MWEKIGEYIWKNSSGRRVYGEFKSSSEVDTWLKEQSNRELLISSISTEYTEYNRDLALRIKNGQVGSGIKLR